MAIVKKVVTRKKVDEESMAYALKTFKNDDLLVEVRILNTDKGTVSGYFNDFNQLETSIKPYDGKYNIYNTISTINPSVFSYGTLNKLKEHATTTTKDADITAYQFVFIDIDPIRPSGVSATDEEKAAALVVSEQLKAYFKEMGLPEPFEMDSGNGYHLFLPTNLENTEENKLLIKKILEGLDFRFSSDKAEVDRTTYNPARITKLYGTMACKGENTEERPHRQSKMLHRPEIRKNTTIEQLQAVVADCLPEVTQHSLPPEAKRWNIPEFIKEHGLDLAYSKPWNNNQLHVLRTCPWNKDHTNDSAYIIDYQNGAVDAGCHHNSCANENWQTLKEKLGIAEEKAEGRQKQSSVILGALADCEFFHDWEDEAYAVVPSGNHREILKISGKKFKRFLQSQYFLKKNSVAGKDAVTEALDIAEVKALFEGEERILEQRVAMTDDNEFFYDLVDSDFQVVKITRDACEVISDPPVNFIRRASMKAQVTPDLSVKPDQLIGLLKQYILIKQEDEYYLFVVTLITCFIKKIPHPILMLHGEKGAAKSTTMTMVKRIVDPCVQDLLAVPTGIDNLSLILNNHYLPAFDNVGMLTAEQANLLCMAVTGGRRSKRTNYSDADETFYDLLNCVLINGINIVSSQTDFLDRTITIEQERVKKNERKTEKKLWKAFDEDKPKILGAIFNTIKAAIPIYETVELEEVGRMADFTEWGYAIAQALGDKGEIFLNAYLKNQSKINDEALSSNPVSTSMMSFMRNKEQWSGTKTNLLSLIETTAIEESINIRQKVWPADASAFSKRLKEVKSNLEEVGIFYEERRSGNSRRIVVTNDNPISSEEEAAMQAERSQCQPTDFSRLNLTSSNPDNPFTNISSVPVSIEDELE
ncbi:MAG: hypothetical protein PHO29_12710 [Acetobacterium sp.]|nr:hypothetical protein [Acetobacterium sp.]